jgi:glycosyltransferase involved in cell wall biosynthesis
MKIGWVEVLRKVYGGTIYENMAQTILSKYCDLEIINVGIENFKKYMYPKVFLRLCQLAGEKEIWVRNLDSTVTMPYDGTKGKNIALIFHIDHSIQPAYLKPPLMMLEKNFYRNLKRVDAIITISKYWQNHFIERGYPFVYLIYCGFDVDQFHFNEGDVLDFKRRFHLEERPIVYLGNCRRIKGIVEAYQHLKDLKVHLVTSGRREVHIPALNLNLNYRDYRLLLRAASVVITMSKFKEGWNRTAHEAMLCKTPVIGSGLGGMRELLEGGDQIICGDFEFLKENVSFALDHPELGERGYEFAKQFTVERFNADWLDVIKRVGKK